MITLIKHRNYALRERESGYNTNNQDEDKGLSYAWSNWCDIESKIEYGSCCPLTCPVLKHGAIKRDFDKALKVSSCVVKWDNIPGIGRVRMHNSRDLKQIQDIRTCTVKREGTDWYISMLVEIPGSLPEQKPLSEVKSINGIDVGVNKLVALSDGSFIENIRVSTNHRIARRVAMRDSCR